MSRSQRPTVDIDTFHSMASEMYDQIPERLLDGLNGGIVISEEARQDDEEELPDVYILGEYIEDPYLGNSIVLYYGSFVALFRDEPVEVWEDELWETMVHEVRHHIEHRAGVYDLDLEDLRQLEEFRRQAREEREAGREAVGKPGSPPPKKARKRKPRKHPWRDKPGRRR